MNPQYQAGVRRDLKAVIPGMVQEFRDSKHYGLEDHLYVFGDATGENLPGIRDPKRREIFVNQITKLIQGASDLESASRVLVNNSYEVISVPVGACVEDLLSS